MSRRTPNDLSRSEEPLLLASPGSRLNQNLRRAKARHAGDEKVKLINFDNT